MARMQKIAKNKPVRDSKKKEEALEAKDVTKGGNRAKPKPSSTMMNKGYKSLMGKKAKDKDCY